MTTFMHYEIDIKIPKFLIRNFGDDIHKIIHKSIYDLENIGRSPLSEWRRAKWKRKLPLGRPRIKVRSYLLDDTNRPSGRQRRKAL